MYIYLRLKLGYTLVYLCKQIIPFANIGESNRIRTVPEYVYYRYLRNHTSYKNIFNK